MALIRQNDTFGQTEISYQRRMPVEDEVTKSVQSVTGETIQFFYYNSSTGVLTQDAGQAAGTVVVANLSNKNVLNALGDVVGNFGDSSFTFGTGTILTTLTPFRGVSAETIERNGFNTTKTGQARAVAVTLGYRNGQFSIDHEHGVIYGVKATAGTADTGTYKVLVPGGSSTIGSNVNVSQIGGVATAAAAQPSDGLTNPTVGSFGAFGSSFNGTTWDRTRSGQTSNSATVTGQLNVLSMARYNAAPTARTEGQFGNLQADANGNINTNLNTLLSGEDQTNNLLEVIWKPVAVSTYAGTKVQNNSFQTTNLKATPGNFLGMRVTNTTGNVRYLQLHNTATTPGGGATAQESFLVPANSAIVIGQGDLPAGVLAFSTGIAFANSSVAATYTAGTNGDLLLNINYI